MGVKLKNYLSKNFQIFYLNFIPEGGTVIQDGSSSDVDISGLARAAVAGDESALGMISHKKVTNNNFWSQL